MRILILCICLLAGCSSEVSPSDIPHDTWIDKFEPRDNGTAKVWFGDKWCIMDQKELAERLLRNDLK